MKLIKGENSMNVFGDKRRKIDNFEEKIRDIYEGLYRYIYYIAKNKTMAEDALQNTLMIAYEKYSTLKDSRSFKSWIYTIAKRQTINLIEKYRREIILEDLNIDSIYTDDFNLSEDIIVKEELKVETVKAINRLRPEYRQIIILRYFNDLSFKEISNVLNVRNNTIRVRHLRAKEELYSYLSFNYFNKENFLEKEEVAK